jgi:magnesium transporter
VRLSDWWRIVLRELPAGLILGLIIGVIAMGRIIAWNMLGLYDYGVHSASIAMAVGVTLVAVVTIGSLSGSMLPFVLRRLGFDPASASAPFVATIVDVSAISLYFSVAYFFLAGKLL